MRLTAAEVRRAAALSMLDLSDEEADVLARELGDILTRIDALDPGPAEDDGVSAALTDSAAAAPAIPLRSDEPGADTLSDPPAEWAPGWRDGFFTVPPLSWRGETPSEGGA